MPGIQLTVELDNRGRPKISQLEGSLERLGDKTKRTGQKWDRSWAGMRDQVKQAGKQVDAFTRKVGAIPTSTQAKLLGAGLAAGLGLAIKQGLSFQANMERTKTQFGVILQDATKARSVIADLVKFSASTPFQIQEIADAEKALTAFGLSGIDILTDVGDAAAGAGIGLGQMAMYLGRIKSGAYGQAFMEIAKAGIATRPMLEGEGLKFDRSGSYVGSADEAIRALRKIIQERFGGMMQKMSETWLGAWSTLKDNWLIFLGKMAGPLFTVLKPRITQITEEIQRWASDENAGRIAEQFGEKVDQMVDKIGELYTAIKQVDDYASKHSILLSAAGGALMGARFGAWGAGIGAIVGALGMMQLKFQTVTNRIKDGQVIWLWMKAAGKSIGEIFRWAGNIFYQFGDAVVKTFQGIGETLDAVWDGIVEVLKNSATANLRAAKLLGESFLAGMTMQPGKAERKAAEAIAVLTDGFEKNKGAFDGIGKIWDDVGKEWGEVAGAASTVALENKIAEWVAEAQRGDIQILPPTIQNTAPAAAAEAATPTASTEGPGTTTGGLPGEDQVQSAVSMLDVYGALADEFWDNYYTLLSERHQGYLDEIAQLEEQHAEYLRSLWEDFYLGGIDRTLQSVADNMADVILEKGIDMKKGLNGIWQDMKQNFIRATLTMAAKWIAAKIRMFIFERGLKKAAAADEAILAASKITANTGITATAAGAAAAEYHAATAMIPFAGPGIATAAIAEMMAGIKAAKIGAVAFREGGIVPGAGSGSEDNILALLSPGEAVIPRSQVVRYGDQTIQNIITGGGAGEDQAMNVTFNISGTGVADIEEEVEENLVPILERLIRQGRFEVA